MNIAIVDDDFQVRAELEEGIREYLLQHYPHLTASAKFATFANAEDFLLKFQPGAFAMIFLDIYMDKITGMEAAEHVRHAGDDTPIVFLTTSTEHQLAGYTVFAAGYLMKPLTASQPLFLQVLARCLPKILARQQRLHITADHAELQIPFHKIRYLDCNNARAVLLHLTDYTLQTSSGYQDCRGQLMDDLRFSECYHRLILNLDAVSRLEEENFLLHNGETIPISRRKKNEVKQQYMKYLLEKTSEI